MDFANNTNNSLDTGFGFANAAVGVFNQYTQASKFVEGSMLYNNTEVYIQDNWKVNSRLTLDYGIRFTHQQPQYDQFQQMSNFFPDKWSGWPRRRCSTSLAAATARSSCTGNIRNAMDPRHRPDPDRARRGQQLRRPSARRSRAPATPRPTASSRRATGISKYGYTWPNVVVGPRFGAAYDITGKQTLIFRGGGGIFYDRPDGNTVFSIPGNPPIATLDRPPQRPVPEPEPGRA